MINKYKSEYPDGDIPLEISFGTSTRQTTPYVNVYTSGVPSTYTGTAEVNMVSIQIGKHALLLTNEQTCGGNNCPGDGDGYSTGRGYRFKIEGEVSGNSGTYGSYSTHITGGAPEYSNQDINFLLTKDSSGNLSSLFYNTTLTQWGIQFDSDKKYSI
jgi:hypothetical protein